MHQTAHLDHRTEIALFDETNPRSLKFLLPEAFAKILYDTFNGPRGELFGLSYQDLLKEMQARDKFPNELDYKIKENFWTEYLRVIENYKKPQPMNISQVIRRLVSKEGFYKHYLTQPEKLAFLMLPPQGFEDMLESALMCAVHKLKRVLEIPLVDKNNEPRIDNMKLVLGIYKELKISLNEIRGYGTPLRKPTIASRVGSPKSAVGQVPRLDSPKEEMTDLERELKELESQKGNLEKIKKEQEPVVPKDSFDV